jgi:hypothetical protein
MTVNLNDQLMPGSFGHTLNHLIDRLDLGAFDAAFRNDKKGAPAWSPNVAHFLIAIPWVEWMLNEVDVFEKPKSVSLRTK